MDRKSIFVRNLPFGISQEELEEFFSEIGPVRKVSVIKSKGSRKTDSLTKGFAFVKFAMEADAEEAIKKFNNSKFQGRKLMIEYAKKKTSGKELDEKKETPVESETPNHQTETPITPTETPVISKDDKKEKKHETQSERNARRKQHRAWLREIREKKENELGTNDKTVTIYRLDTSISEKKLKQVAKRYGRVNTVDIQKVTEDLDDKSVIARIEYKKSKDADKAKTKLDGQKIQGIVVQARIAGKVVEKKTKAQKTRLIFRNLAFEVTEKELQPYFKPYGPITELKVVRMPSEDPKELGRSRGFGFVQYNCEEDAAKALESVNGTKIKNREIVVDLSLPKAQFTTIAAEPKVEEDTVEDGTDQAGEEESADEQSDDDDDNVSEEEMSESDDDNEKPIVVPQPKDSNEAMARTLFIRNVSFQSTVESLQERFEEFGPVRYVKIAMDHETGLSKGVAFVRFNTLEAAELALKEAATSDGKSNDGTGIEADGRLLSVCRAVSRGEAGRLADENSKEREKQDKRNLYLRTEGYVDTKEAEEEREIPKTDIEKRKRAIKEKKEKLKSPMHFISPVRLSIRSLNYDIDDKELKSICHKAAVDGMKAKLVNHKEVKAIYRLPLKASVKVVMAKVVVDTDKVTGTETGSKGFAFVEFTQHVHALAALRQLNNNPVYTKHTLGGSKLGDRKVPVKDKPRLIVEFAVENHAKIKLREKRQNLAQKKREEKEALKRAQSEEPTTPTSVVSRGKKQREKKRKAKELGGTEELSAPVVPIKTKAPKKITKPEEEKPAKKRRRSKAKEDDGLKVQASRKERRAGKRKEREAENHLEDLVSKYKTQLFGVRDKDTSANRWFE